ncbi:MAG: hypothetical protein IPM51_03470 [Sphingobacteriaceae bacterium]|nr:hypothetical protein [Sphingobacteriaceae bacterium]
MHKPLHSLFFAALLFLALGLLSFSFPEEGLAVKEDLTLNFPSLQSLFSPKAEKKDISAIIAMADAMDTVSFNVDTANVFADSLIKEILIKDTVKKVLKTGLQYNNRSCLSGFFDALADIKKSNKSIRVLHYGDSQIEGDRITDYLRLKLQGQFGGQGPGLFSAMPIAQSIITKVKASDGFDRYNTFTGKDKRVHHSNFGVLGGFARFAPYKNVSDSSQMLSAEININTSKLGGVNATKYTKLKLFYGGSQTKTWCEFYDGPALSGADSLESNGYFRVKEYKVGLGSLSHSFKFKGKDSPDFYSFSLESDQGIYVDNIGLRGSSGTFFHHINSAQLKQFYDYLNVKLIILQFGGNAIPSIKDGSIAVNYAGYLRSQISIIKKLAPQASIIFVGPADMSVKEGTEYKTHPQLENTRNALKKIVLESGCAFFDMYDCMGGENSMPEWVEQKLAATDYIHFSPQGARKIATLFYSAIMNEYNAYLKSKK